MTSPLGPVSAHLRSHFASRGIESAPDVASVTFLGVEQIDVLRFGPDADGVLHHVTLGCSRHPMSDPAAPVADPLVGPRAELVLSIRAGASTPGLVRSLAVVAATPAVEGVVLRTGALIDLSAPLWQGSAFAAVLLGDSGIGAVELAPPSSAVEFLSAVPITQIEGAWARLKGAAALRQAWIDDGVDVLDPFRPASSPGGS